MCPGGRLAVLCERWGLSTDLRDVDEVRTTAGDVGAGADMVELLCHRCATQGANAGLREEQRTGRGATRGFDQVKAV